MPDLGSPGSARVHRETPETRAASIPALVSPVPVWQRAGVMISERAMQSFILAACALALQTAGCAAELTTEGSSGRVGKAVPHPAGRELGIVYGSGSDDPPR